MAFDYKKEYKEFYLPKQIPAIVEIPEMPFLAVRGKGDPNVEGGEYKAAIGLLYGIAFTIKMSKLGSHRMAGYFDYVVPPLEGLWWQVGEATAKKKTDYSKVEFLTYAEGLCVQCMHIGPYDEEGEAIQRMVDYAQEAGYAIDLPSSRYHHEIYLSDARKVQPDKRKTVIRLPIRKRE